MYNLDLNWISALQRKHASQGISKWPIIPDYCVSHTRVVFHNEGCHHFQFVPLLESTFRCPTCSTVQWTTLQNEMIFTQQVDTCSVCSGLVFVWTWAYIVRPCMETLTNTLINMIFRLPWILKHWKCRHFIRCNI